MGLAARQPNWERIKRNALDRDGWRCRDCAKAGRLEVHHVRPLREGGGNALANLRTLCVACHKAAHAPALTPEQQELAAMVAEL